MSRILTSRVTWISVAFLVLAVLRFLWGNGVLR